MRESRKKKSSELNEGISCEVNKRWYKGRIRTRKIFFNPVKLFGLARCHLFDIVLSRFAIFGKVASVVVGRASFSQAVCSG